MVVLGNTFTQGYKRYNFRYVGDGAEAEFTPITHSASIKDIYCTIPAQNTTPIHRLSLSYAEHVSPLGAISWIRDVFHDRDIKTVLWTLGDMHSDFGNKRKFILYDPGGSGKSSVVNILGSAISGSLSTPASSAILVNPNSYHTKTIDTSALLDAACSRMVTTADIKVTDRKILNMQTINAFTGNHMSNGGVRVNVTVVATMNGL